MPMDSGTGPGAAILGAIRGPYRLSSGASVAPLGNGHINQTVLVIDGERRLVAQRINTAVFKRPQDLVHNALAIGNHLAGKDEELRVARHVPGLNGQFLYGPQEDVRVLEYFPGTRSIEVLEDAGQAFRAANKFAHFSRLLSDFDARELVTVLPDFHNPALRWAQFSEALRADVAGRAGDCRQDVEFVMAEASWVGEWRALMESLPLRVCHNDCKINNLLFDAESGEAVAIIDLDTCMPGPILTDFGDLVRTCCSPEAEDSTRLAGVRARPEIFNALLNGYVEGWSGEITAAERASLVPGGLMMCFVIGLRFLTDFLAGDRYFAIDHPRHNLERARNQFQLYRSLAGQRKSLEALS